MAGEPCTDRESGPVHRSGSTGQCGAGAQAPGGRVQRRSQQAAVGKNQAVCEPQEQNKDVLL